MQRQLQNQQNKNKQPQNNKPKKMAQPARKRPLPPLVRTLQKFTADECEAACQLYTQHVVDPEHTDPSPIPIQSMTSNDYGLVTTTNTFDVTVNLSGTGPDVGRGAFIVNPTLGDGSHAPDYKIHWSITNPVLLLVGQLIFLWTLLISPMSLVLL